MSHCDYLVEERGQTASKETPFCCYWHFLLVCFILAWRIPCTEGAWWATVHGVTEWDTMEATQHIEHALSMAQSPLPNLR